MTRTGPLPDTLPPPGTYEITVRTFTTDGGMFRATRWITEPRYGMEAAVEAAARAMYRQMAEGVEQHEEARRG
jgi:hypothetical protein